MLGYVHDSTTIWHFWDPRRRQVIQASNVTFIEAAETMELELGIDTSACELGVSDGGPDNKEGGRGLVAPNGRGFVPVDNLGGNQVSTQTTSRYDLRKRPRVVVHRIRVEEESMDSADPVSYQEAIEHPRLGQQWSDAVGEELRSLAENSTWDYVRLEDVPAGVTPISSKWVFKTKELPGGGVRYKARLDIRGFEQQPGVDFDETFAPVAKLQSLRMMLALAAIHDWEIDQMDVVTAFLNPKIDDDVYMVVPQGIESGGSQVCKLRKSLYGLKQAPRLWYVHIDQFLRSLGLKRCEYDPNVYLSASITLANRTDTPLAIWKSKKSADTPIILLLYVDDMLLFSPSADRVTTLKNLLHAKYKMTDLGPVRCFLGIEIERDRPRRTLQIHQQRAVRKLLATFGFSQCNGHWTPQPMGSKLRRLDPDSDSEKTSVNAGQSLVDSDSKRRYQSMVGSLMWLMLCTRPDLAFTVSMLSKFNDKPTTEHLAAATYALRYLRNTANLGIQYNTQNSNMPIGYTDSDFAGHPDDRKSTSGYVFMLAGGAVSWRARKQPLVAFSTVEAEYIGASDAAKEAIWIQSLYSRVLYGQTLYQHADLCPHCLCPDDNSQAQTVEPQEIFVDNQGAIQLAKNPKFHERTKHISVRFHFIRDACERKAIKTTYLPTSDMLADIMTKNLPRETHWKHAHGLGLVCRDTGEASSETEAGGGKRRKRFK